MEKERSMYKCCWNCLHGSCMILPTREETERFEVSFRICSASYPVSNRPENPFKRRNYCKRFEPKLNHRPIDRLDAYVLDGMTVENRLEIFGKVINMSDK